MHNMNYLHLPTQDGAVAISPIRLELVKKLQRLVPEMGFTTIEVTTDNSSMILYDIVMNLNGRASDRQNQYGDVLETRNMQRVAQDRWNGDETEDSDTDSARWSVDDLDGLPMGLERPLR